MRLTLNHSGFTQDVVSARVLPRDRARLTGLCGVAVGRRPSPCHPAAMQPEWIHEGSIAASHGQSRTLKNLPDVLDARLAAAAKRHRGSLNQHAENRALRESRL